MMKRILAKLAYPVLLAGAWSSTVVFTAAHAVNDLPGSFEQICATQSSIGRMKAAAVNVAIGMIDDDDTRQLAHDLGVRFFLRKPVDDQALLDAIAWVVQEAA